MFREWLYTFQLRRAIRGKAIAEDRSRVKKLGASLCLITSYRKVHVRKHAMGNEANQGIAC